MWSYRNKKTMNYKRLLYIDNLRGILILLVILGHCIQFLDADFDHNLAFKYIYAFHMPLFMFISGFVGFLQKSGFQVIKKRFCQLIIPFTAWSVILYFINSNKTGGRFLIISSTQIGRYGFFGYYFLSFLYLWA